MSYEDSAVGKKPLPPHKAGGHKIEAGKADGSSGAAFDDAGKSHGGVSNDISAKSGTKALTREQRHAAQIKRSGAGHEKQQAATTVEKDRLARYADACRRAGQMPDTSDLKPSGQASDKPSYLQS